MHNAEKISGQKTITSHFTAATYGKVAAMQFMQIIHVDA